MPDPEGLDRLERPTVAAPYVPVVLGPDRVQFRIGPWAGPAFTVVDHDGDGRLAEAIGAIDGRRSIAEVLETVGDDHREAVRGLLEELDGRGVLVDSGVPPPAGGFTTERASFGPDAEAGLRSAQLLVVGIGGIGRAVAADLVRAGAGAVDLVEPAGAPGDRAASPPPGLDVVEGDDADLERLVPEADLVAYAADRPDPETARSVNALALEDDVPWIPGQVVGLEGFVGPAVVPGETACLECFRRRVRSNLEEPTGYDRFETAAASRGTTVGLSAMARVVAGFLTVDLLHAVATGTGITAGRVIHFDFFALTVESNAVLKLPRCPACGPDRGTLDRSRHLGLDGLLEGR